ncbi:MAG TPA: hypothetical protein VFN82_06655 [Solirubrobacterales bacterium]|nr:hypothetical protein [Solirubrobacterales bacterium]
MTEVLLDARGRDSGLPERERNESLRRVDWRFLLRCRELPRAIDLAPGPDSEALRLVSESAGPGEADLVLAGFPTLTSLRSVRAAMAPGGEVVCRWWVPRLAGPQRAVRRLRRAGFVDVRLYWAGPQPNRPPQFWLPLESREALSYVLAKRPPKSPAGAGLRRLWRWAARLGYLAPMYALARLPGEQGEEESGGDRSPMLLTGGHRSINKVVALDFTPGALRPSAAAKFARVAEAEAGLEREASILARLAEERPGVEGIPEFRQRLRRCGREGVVEGAVDGDSMLDRLTPKSFPEMARRVTDLLIELAGKRGGEGRRTTVEEHLGFFESRFGSVLDEEQLAALRSGAEAVAGLPVVCEHRDCSPWNLVLAARDRPALLDWESAEPHGLPGLDLAYFLANAAFVLDKALEGGTTRASYRRLLDPGTPYGAVAAAETARYCEALDLDPELMPVLRRLCWMVHCRSDYEHLRLAAAGEPASEDLRKAPFLGLLLEELERAPR